MVENTWDIRLWPDVEAQILALAESDPDLCDQITARIDMLSEYGPSLGRPIVDRIKGSTIHNMKELRADSIRILFVFDPKSRGILLVMGDKRATGEAGIRQRSRPQNSDFVNGRRVMTMSEKPVSWGSARAKLGRDPERVAAARHAAESEILAYQLVTLRKEADLTQTELSKTMGVSQRRVSAIEHGQLESFELDTIRKYVAALGGQVRVVADFGDRSVTLAS